MHVWEVYKDPHACLGETQGFLCMTNDTKTLMHAWGGYNWPAHLKNTNELPQSQRR